MSTAHHVRFFSDKVATPLTDALDERHAPAMRASTGRLGAGGARLAWFFYLVMLMAALCEAVTGALRVPMVARP